MHIFSGSYMYTHTSLTNYPLAKHPNTFRELVVVGGLAGCLVGWPVGWLAGWLVGAGPAQFET